MAALLFLVAGATTAHASPETSESAKTEAIRQIRFARSEIAKSRFKPALASAESALRLCPECREATLLKALAYDGLGDRRLAVSLLKAYKEEAPEAERSKADRILDWFVSTPRSRPDVSAHAVGGRGFAEIGGLTAARPPADLGADAYRERLVEALAQNRCASALSAAEELIRALPDDPDAYRSAGPAAVCAGDARMAVRILQRWRDLGVEDPEGERLLEATASAAGRLTIAVEEGWMAWAWMLDADGEWIAPERGDGVLTFEALPPGVELTVVALRPGETEPVIEKKVAPLRSAESRRIQP
jgi:tetratricopeptide (TPR) repeat protein